jgi:molybdenum cofactor cytidylyltransferase
MNDSTLSVLIPAAGSSTRLGQPKQLVAQQGKSLIQHAVEKAQSLSPLEIIVVTGANAELIEAETQQLPVRCLYNPLWSAGVGGSIALGTEAINPKSTGLMILLCDQWRLQTQDLQKLLVAWQSEPDRIVCARAESINMPPVIFPSICFAELRAVKGERGARSVLQTYESLLCPVTMKNANFDLDTNSHLDSMERIQD